MAAAIVGGPYTWSGERDDEGHRTYTITHRVKTLQGEGPATVMQCPGLPDPGDTWAVDDDLDIWAWCLPGMRINPERAGENQYWKVEQKFSTKPPENSKQRCNTTPIEDPLLEPQKINGSFVRKTEEGIKDRFGKRIITSSHEQITGPQNEWDADGGDLIIIEQNVADLELDILSSMKNTLNDAPLWGLPARCIKFSSYTWEKKFYGSCEHYYTRRLEFEVNRKGFDRDLLDEGTKVLHGYWDEDTGEWVLDYVASTLELPDKDNPAHFDRFKDRNGENARVILDGEGQPYVPTELVLDCAQCPDGAPIIFKVKTGADREVEITYTSGCTWQTVDEGTVTLTYDSGVWKLTDTAWSGSEWTLDEEDWNCLGPNSMTRTTGTLGLATATVSDPSNPGSIHVEKYDESDLLELGIPVTF